MSRTKREPTQTGGRSATTRTVMGEYALAVGMPKAVAPQGWSWSKLSDIARLESGHTPSRRKPEYWDGDVPWIGIKDAREHHGEEIVDTLQHTNDLGLANSSARLLPVKTVCLSRTASVGYVIVMGREMATSQDFVNWICSDELDHEYLKYLLIAEKPAYRKFSSGAVHQTIYFPEAKAFHVCHPEVAEQKRIVSILDEAFSAIAKAKENAEKNLLAARELFESYLNRVFTQLWDEFEIVTMSDLATDIRDGDHNAPPKSESGVPFITISNINKSTRQIDFSNTFTVPRDYFEGLKPNRKPQRRDVLYTVTGSFGIPVIVDHDTEFCFQRHIGLIRPIETVAPRWLYYLCLTPQVFNQAARRATGTAQKTVSLKVLRSMEVPNVPFSKQKEMVPLLDEIDTETRRLETIYTQKLANLDELKQSLLQKAFTGQLTDSIVQKSSF